MKRLLLAGTAFLGFAASGSIACATPFDFTYTGSIVQFTVPTTGTYQILAFGAQGGPSHVPPPGVGGDGGLGAEIGGDFALIQGEVLQIAVGGAGADGGGGGGGSFVVAPSVAPLVIAGGGGGGGARTMFPTDMGIPGQGGLTGPDGGNAGGLIGSGGTNGNGGSSGGGFEGAGAGGGFFSAGGSGTIATGGGDFLQGLLQGDPGGGFGGGGGFGINGAGEFGGGGGGGYSGGGGGSAAISFVAPGGGGGSFDTGLDQIFIGGYQAGNGEVVITELVSEPGSLALLGSALIGLAVVWRRRRPGTLGYAGADYRLLDRLSTTLWRRGECSRFYRK